MKTIKTKLLGKDIEVKKLTVGDMFKLREVLSDDVDEATQMFTMVSLALVEPKMTVKEIYDLEPKYLDDLTKIVEIATTQE